MKLTRIAALILALGAGTAAYAGGVATTLNDLVLGFQQSGASSNLEINLGNITTFAGATGGGIAGTLDLGNINTILTNAYGSGWTTSSTLNWGVAGSAGAIAASDGSPAKTAWITAQWTTSTGALGTQNSTAWAAKSSSSLGTASTAIGKIYNGLSGTGGTVATNVASNAVTVSTSDGAGQSWTQVEGTGAAAFGVFNPNTTFNNQTGRLATGATYSASDLYALAPSTAGVFLGTFAISNTGELTFTGSLSAVPEPSTYAVFAGLAALAFVGIRRRRRATLPQA